MLVILGFQDFASAAQTAVPQIGAKLTDVLRPAAPDFGLSESVAVVEDHYSASSESAGRDRFVILVRDAHANPSGQINLAKTIDAVAAQLPLPAVFTEGADRDVSISFLREYGSAGDRARVALEFLRKGELKGSEYQQLTGSKDFAILGVEENRLYRRSVEVYRRVSRERKQTRQFLEQIQITARHVAHRVLNPELRAFAEKREAFRAGGMSWVEYLEALSATALANGVTHTDFGRLEALHKVRRLEKQTDFNAVRQELTRLAEESSETDWAGLIRNLGRSDADGANGQILLGVRLKSALKNNRGYPHLRGYLRYLNEMKRLRLRDLPGEQKALEAALIDRLARSADEARLMRLLDAVSVLQKLSSLEWTPGDRAAWNERREDHDPVRITAFLNRKLQESGRSPERVLFLDETAARGLRKAMRFYALADTRDRVFVRRLLKQMEERGMKTGLLITGGFHTEHLSHLLREKKISYAVVTPQVYEETDRARYEKLLLAPQSSLMDPYAVSSGAVYRIGARLGADRSDIDRAVLGGARLASWMGRFNRPSSGSPEADPAPDPDVKNIHDEIRRLHQRNSGRLFLQGVKVDLQLLATRLRHEALSGGKAAEHYVALSRKADDLANRLSPAGQNIDLDIEGPSEGAWIADAKALSADADFTGRIHPMDLMHLYRLLQILKFEGRSPAEMARLVVSSDDRAETAIGALFFMAGHLDLYFLEHNRWSQRLAEDPELPVLHRDLRLLAGLSQPFQDSAFARVITKLRNTDRLYDGLNRRAEGRENHAELWDALGSLTKPSGARLALGGDDADYLRGLARSQMWKVLSTNVLFGIGAGTIAHIMGQSDLIDAVRIAIIAAGGRFLLDGIREAEDTAWMLRLKIESRKARAAAAGAAIESLSRMNPARFFTAAAEMSIPSVLRRTILEANNQVVLPMRFALTHGGEAPERKSDGSLVTLADRDAQRWILRSLLKRLALVRFKIMAEEPLDRLSRILNELNPEAELMLVVDPIDGTSAYTRAGYTGFGTAAAVVRLDRAADTAEVIAAVFYAPEQEWDGTKGLLIEASKHEPGIRVNGKRWDRMRELEPDQNQRIFVHRRISDALTQPGGLDFYSERSSSSLELARIILGVDGISAFASSRTKYWDLLPALYLIQKAGGSAVRLDDGRPIVFKASDLESGDTYSDPFIVGRPEAVARIAPKAARLAENVRDNIRRDLLSHDPQIATKTEGFLARLYLAMERTMGSIVEKARTGVIDPAQPIRLLKDSPEAASVSDRPLRVGVLALAANPLNWGHVLLALMTMDQLNLDKVVFLVQGEIQYKNIPEADRVPTRKRHEMVVDALKELQPLIEYTDIALDNQTIGEFNFPKILQMNPDRKIKLFYISGTETRERTAKIGTNIRQSVEQNRILENPNHEVGWAVIPRGSGDFGNRVTQADLDALVAELGFDPASLETRVIMDPDIDLGVSSTYYRTAHDPSAVPRAVDQAAIANGFYWHPPIDPGTGKPALSDAEMFGAKLRPLAEKIADRILAVIPAEGGMVSIDGPSGSGKSSLAVEVQSALRARGRGGIVIGLDVRMRDRAWRQAVHKLVVGEVLSESEIELIRSRTPDVLNHQPGQEFLGEELFMDHEGIRRDVLEPVHKFFQSDDQEFVLKVRDAYDQSTKKVLAEKEYPPIRKGDIVLAEGKYGNREELAPYYAFRIRLRDNRERVRARFEIRQRRQSPYDADRQVKFFNLSLGPSYDKVYAPRTWSAIDLVADIEGDDWTVADVRTTEGQGARLSLYEGALIDLRADGADDRGLNRIRVLRRLGPHSSSWLAAAEPVDGRRFSVKQLLADESEDPYIRSNEFESAGVFDDAMALHGIRDLGLYLESRKIGVKVAMPASYDLAQTRIGWLPEDKIRIAPYVPGRTMDEWIASRPDLRERLRVLRSLAQAFSELERLGLPGVWDIKSGNIIIDDGGTPWLIDYNRMRISPTGEFMEIVRKTLRGMMRVPRAWSGMSLGELAAAIPDGSIQDSRQKSLIDAAERRGRIRDYLEERGSALAGFQRSSGWKAPAELTRGDRDWLAMALLNSVRDHMSSDEWESPDSNDMYLYRGQKLQEVLELRGYYRSETFNRLAARVLGEDLARNGGTALAVQALKLTLNNLIEDMLRGDVQPKPIAPTRLEWIVFKFFSDSQNLAKEGFAEFVEQLSLGVLLPLALGAVSTALFLNNHAVLAASIGFWVLAYYASRPIIEYADKKFGLHTSWEQKIYHAKIYDYLMRSDLKSFAADRRKYEDRIGRLLGAYEADDARALGSIETALEAAIRIGGENSAPALDLRRRWEMARIDGMAVQSELSYLLRRVLPRAFTERRWFPRDPQSRRKIIQVAENAEYLRANGASVQAVLLMIAKEAADNLSLEEQKILHRALPELFTGTAGSGRESNMDRVIERVRARKDLADVLGLHRHRMQQLEKKKGTDRLRAEDLNDLDESDRVIYRDAYIRTMERLMREGLPEAAAPIASEIRVEDVVDAYLLSDLYRLAELRKKADRVDQLTTPLYVRRVEALPPLWASLMERLAQMPDGRLQVPSDRIRRWSALIADVRKIGTDTVYIASSRFKYPEPASGQPEQDRLAALDNSNGKAGARLADAESADGAASPAEELRRLWSEFITTLEEGESLRPLTEASFARRVQIAARARGQLDVVGDWVERYSLEAPLDVAIGIERLEKLEAPAYHVHAIPGDRIERLILDAGAAKGKVGRIRLSIGRLSGRSDAPELRTRQAFAKFLTAPQAVGNNRELVQRIADSFIFDKETEESAPVRRPASRTEQINSELEAIVREHHALAWFVLERTAKNNHIWVVRAYDTFMQFYNSLPDEEKRAGSRKIAESDRDFQDSISVLKGVIRSDYQTGYRKLIELYVADEKVRGLISEFKKLNPKHGARLAEDEVKWPFAVLQQGELADDAKKRLTFESDRTTIPAGAKSAVSYFRSVKEAASRAEALYPRLMEFLSLLHQYTINHNPSETTLNAIHVHYVSMTEAVQVWNKDRSPLLGTAGAKSWLNLFDRIDRYLDEYGLRRRMVLGASVPGDTGEARTGIADQAPRGALRDRLELEMLRFLSREGSGVGLSARSIKEGLLALGLLVGALDLTNRAEWLTRQGLLDKAGGRRGKQANLYRVSAKGREAVDFYSANPASEAGLKRTTAVPADWTGPSGSRLAAGPDVQEQIRRWHEAGGAPRRILRILINEDDEDQRMLIRLRLMKRSFADDAVIEEYPRSEEALEAFRRQLQSGKPYDLVITDHNTKSMSTGAELIRQARHEEMSAATTPSVIIYQSATLDEAMDQLGSELDRQNLFFVDKLNLFRDLTRILDAVVDETPTQGTRLAKTVPARSSDQPLESFLVSVRKARPRQNGILALERGVSSGLPGGRRPITRFRLQSGDWFERQVVRREWTPLFVDGAVDRDLWTAAPAFKAALSTGMEPANYLIDLDRLFSDVPDEDVRRRLLNRVVRVAETIEASGAGRIVDVSVVDWRSRTIAGAPSVLLWNLTDPGVLDRVGDYDLQMQYQQSENEILPILSSILLSNLMARIAHTEDPALRASRIRDAAPIFASLTTGPQLALSEAYLKQMKTYDPALQYRTIRPLQLRGQLELAFYLQSLSRKWTEQSA